MLKLEKCARSYRITVSLRERETFFSPLLLKALAFALALHLAAIAFFHIRPFKPTTSFLFPPIQVQTESQPLITSPLLILQESPEDEPLLAPPSPLDFCSSRLLCPPSPNQHMTEVKTVRPSFLSLEQRHWPLAMPSLTSLIEKPAISFFTSGDLSSYELAGPKDSRLEKTLLLPFSHPDPLYISYHVRLDEKSGTIFWHERIQSSPSAEINLLTEQILLDATFKTKRNSPPMTITGWIHFVVYTETPSYTE